MSSTRNNTAERFYGTWTLNRDRSGWSIRVLNLVLRGVHRLVQIRMQQSMEQVFARLPGGDKRTNVLLHVENGMFLNLSEIVENPTTPQPVPEFNSWVRQLREESNP